MKILKKNVITEKKDNVKNNIKYNQNCIQEESILSQINKEEIPIEEVNFLLADASRDDWYKIMECDELYSQTFIGN